MLNIHAVNGLIKATPEKRYKSFLNTVADLEKIWFLSTKDGYATIDIDGDIHVLVFPREEFCEMLISADEKPVSMEIHAFVENSQKLDGNIRFMVFPTKDNSYVVTNAQLCADILLHLDEIE